MPRSLVRAPGHDRSRSLGWLVLAWLEHFMVHGPGDVQGDPVEHGDEYSGFIADCYALDENGRRLYDSAFLSRPKGSDKSGQGARFGLAEAFAPVRFAGWAKGGEIYSWHGFEYVYEPGEPMGRRVTTPFIRCMATEEEQVGNVYDTIYFNCTEGPLSEIPEIARGAGLTRILIPGGGEITPSTASSAAKDGGKETFVCFDETHLYTTAELRAMYKTVTRNLRKRKKIAETWFLETTTMFAPGSGSIAEKTFELAEAILEGRTRRARQLYDHRWGECDDLTDEPALRAAIRDAFGDALAWNDLDGIVDEFYDPRADVSDSRRFFLNAKTSASDAWMDEPPWAACKDPDEGLVDGDIVTLGFDGSVTDDSTALVACRVEDGYLEPLRVDEKPVGPEGDHWRVDTVAMDAAVADAFERYDVVGFYADPPFWQDYVDKWSAEFGDGLEVKATERHPIEWWTNRTTTMVYTLKRFHDAVTGRGISHNGGNTLTRHVLNARRRVGRVGITISKEHPGSPNKIDAAMAAVLAYEARADAIAAGVLTRRRAKKRSRRIRRY